MRKHVTIPALALLMLSFVCMFNDASAQRRYRHLKRARTEEGFTVEPAQKKTKTVTTGQTTTPVTAEVMKEAETAPAPTPADETAVAGIETKNTAFREAVKQIKVKDLFKEKELAQTARSLVYSNQAMAKSGLDKMLAPEKVNEMKPGMLLIILGSVAAGVAITLWIVGTIVFLGSSGYNFGIYILFIVLGILLWFGGLAMIAVGIVKLIRSRRGH